MHRTWCGTLFLAGVLWAATASDAGDVLVNGDFEQAGVHNTHDPGAGWLAGSLEDFTVLGMEGWWQDALPFEGYKAMGVASHTQIDEGTLEQTVLVKTGRYRVVVTGHAWVYDNYGGDGLESYIDPRLYVDGQVVRSRQLTGPGPKQWFAVRYEWTGTVKRDLCLSINARGDGRSADGWGVVITDGWTMEVEADPRAPETLLANGDFEQAGPVASHDVGPGWTSRSEPQVFGPGTIVGYVPTFAPYDGDKAVGVIANTIDGSCAVEQTATLDPGVYELTLSGHLFLWDTFGGDHYNSYAEVYFMVDGRDVQYKRVWCGSPLGPELSWGELKWSWTGEVKEGCGLHLDMQARGAGDIKSWGLCAADGWRIAARRLRADPDATNLLVNGTFQEAGAVGSGDPGPGWTADGALRVSGPLDIWSLFRVQDPYDTFFRSHPSLAPFRGDKAMAIVSHSTDESGTLVQTVPLAPGDYDLTLTGRVWQWDTWGGGDYDPYVIVSLAVDDQTVTQERVGYDEEDHPEHWWGRVRHTWSGQVEREACVTLEVHTLGAGPGESWSGSAVDDWMLHAERVKRRAAPKVTARRDASGCVEARWRFAHPGDGVPAYRFAIGSSPGEADVLPWTDAGPRERLLRCGLGLQPDRSYYVGVKTRTADGRWTQPGIASLERTARRKEQ